MEFSPIDALWHLLKNVPFSPSIAVLGSLEHNQAILDEWTVT